MGIFAKKKADGYQKQDGKRLSDENDTSQDYEPPKIEPSVSKLFVEVDKESNHGSVNGYSKGNLGFANTGTATGEAMLSGSSIDGTSARMLQNLQTARTRTDGTKPTKAPSEEPYLPIRYESAKPPNIYKAPPPPASPPVSPSKSLTSPSMSSCTKMNAAQTHASPSHYRCMSGSCMPSLNEVDGDGDDGIVQESPPRVPPLKKCRSKDATSVVTPIPQSNSPKCGCFELGMCGDDETVPTAPANPVSLPKRGVLSTFSRRINSFSQHVQSHSFRGARNRAMLNNTSLYSDLNKSPSRNKMKYSVLDEDNENRTLSTGSDQSKQDSLLSFTKISLDGTLTLVTANEEAQAQIEKWKRAAVVGNPVLRVAAIFFSISVVITTIFMMAFVDYAWNKSRIICSVHTLLSTTMILILEVRRGDEEEVACPEETIRYQMGLRRLVVTHFNVFKFVWGRGWLYIFTGTMALTLNMFAASIPGIFLIFLGILTVAIGSYAVARLETLKTSYADDAFLEDKFQDQDIDRNGKINQKEFGSLLWAIGLEMSESQIAAVFRSIDIQQRGRISFQQFKDWWFSGPSSADKEARRNRSFGQFVISKTSQSQRLVAVKRVTSESGRLEVLV
jgi:uncharacterized protein YneF (UPF0154 family)